MTSAGGMQHAASPDTAAVALGRPATTRWRILLAVWPAAIVTAEALLALGQASLGLALYVVLLAGFPLSMAFASGRRLALVQALLVLPVTRLLAAALLVPGVLGSPATQSELERWLAPLASVAARSLGLTQLPPTAPGPPLDWFATAGLLVLLVERELALSAGARFRPLVRTASLAGVPMLLAFLVTAALRLRAAG